jgi:hypothetical protein
MGLKTNSFIGNRLYSQRIIREDNSTPELMLAHLGAIQGQDYYGTKWAIGLRYQGSTETEIDSALFSGRIIRTWLFRGTLHFTTSEFARQVIPLIAPRLIKGAAGRNRQLGLDESIFKNAMRRIGEELECHGALTRENVYALLNRMGISSEGQRGYHILWRAALEGLICCGPNKEKEQTFVLLPHDASRNSSMGQEELISQLLLTYFRSRGPASLQDFLWWSGMRATDVRPAVEGVRSRLDCVIISGVEYFMVQPQNGYTPENERAFLLPGFDEYLLGYKDRSAVLDAEFAPRICPGGNGMFLPTLVLNGRVCGVWKRTLRKKEMLVEIQSFHKLSRGDRQRIAEAVFDFEAFLSRPARIEYV